MDCPFCHIAASPQHQLGATEHAVAFHDAYPSAPGHTLIVPRRHLGRVVALTESESDDLWRLARRQLEALAPTCDSVSIGINDGPQAGQTVPHVHLHLIPRFHGDVVDPRGGIRWVLPDTAPYWQSRY